MLSFYGQTRRAAKLAPRGGLQSLPIPGMVLSASAGTSGGPRAEAENSHAR